MDRTIYEQLVTSGAGDAVQMSLERVQWDAENRLVGIVQASGTTGFVYDGAGHTVQETLNGTLIKQWVWCGSQPCEERDGSGNVTKRFYAQGEQIAGTPYYFTRDHLGSVREMTDSTGAIRAQYDYDPFGRVTKIQGNLSADFGFTGDYYHAASGLSLTIYRAYDPNLGRWLNADPIGLAGGINLYAYVGNNPISRVDPYGLFAPSPVIVLAPVATGIGVVGTGALALAPIAGYGYYQLGNLIGDINAPDASDFHGPGVQTAMPPPRPPTITKAPAGFPGDECENHHRLPQQFKNWFESPPRNLNIEDYTQSMPQQWHTGADIGLHPNGYNAAWGDFISQNPNASAADTLQFLNQAEADFGFGP